MVRAPIDDLDLRVRRQPHEVGALVADELHPLVAGGVVGDLAQLRLEAGVELAGGPQLPQVFGDVEGVRGDAARLRALAELRPVAAQHHAARRPRRDDVVAVVDGPQELREVGVDLALDAALDARVHEGHTAALLLGDHYLDVVVGEDLGAGDGGIRAPIVQVARVEEGRLARGTIELSVEPLPVLPEPRGECLGGEDRQRRLAMDAHRLLCGEAQRGDPVGGIRQRRRLRPHAAEPVGVGEEAVGEAHALFARVDEVGP